MGYLDCWLYYRCAGPSKGRIRRASCVLGDGMAGSGDYCLHDFYLCSPGIPFQRRAASSGPKGLVSIIQILSVFRAFWTRVSPTTCVRGDAGRALVYECPVSCELNSQKVSVLILRVSS